MSATNTIDGCMSLLNEFIKDKDVDGMTDDGIKVFLNILNILFLTSEEQNNTIDFSDLMEFDELYIFSQIAIYRFCKHFNELPILKYESKEELERYSEEWQKILNYLDDVFSDKISIVIYNEIKINLNMKYPTNFNFNLESTNNWTSLYNKLKTSSTKVN